MSCEISFGLVEDISRLTTHDQVPGQPIVIEFCAANGKL